MNVHSLAFLGRLPLSAQCRCCPDANRRSSALLGAAATATVSIAARIPAISAAPGCTALDSDAQLVVSDCACGCGDECFKIAKTNSLIFSPVSHEGLILLSISESPNPAHQIVQAEICCCISQDTPLNEQHIAASRLDPFDHTEDVVTLLLVHTIHLQDITTTVLVSLGCRET